MLQRGDCPRTWTRWPVRIFPRVPRFRSEGQANRAPSDRPKPCHLHISMHEGLGSAAHDSCLRRLHICKPLVASVPTLPSAYKSPLSAASNSQNQRHCDQEGRRERHIILHTCVHLKSLTCMASRSNELRKALDLAISKWAVM